MKSAQPCPHSHFASAMLLPTQPSYLSMWAQHLGCLVPQMQKSVLGTPHRSRLLGEPHWIMPAAALKEGISN